MSHLTPLALNLSPVRGSNEFCPADFTWQLQEANKTTYVKEFQKC